MNRTPKRLVWTIIAAIALVSLLAVQSATNPLRKSEAEIKSWLLLKTPLGEGTNSVNAFITRQGSAKNFLRRPDGGVEFESEVGSYQGLPWWVVVRATWTFDSSERLIDIEVEKIIDSP